MKTKKQERLERERLERELDEQGERILVTWEAKCYMDGCKRPARYLANGIFFCLDHEPPTQRNLL